LNKVDKKYDILLQGGGTMFNGKTASDNIYTGRVEVEQEVESGFNYSSGNKKKL